MKARALEIWQTLRTSYWFVPGLMVAGAIALAASVATIEASGAASGHGWPQWLITHQVENARIVLATIAGSMMTVAGVTFSIVIVALSLASSQFGPRLLVNFMRDTGNQITLGTFVSTFVYCILVLQQIDDRDFSSPALPLAVALAVALALVSLGVLIYFFHHVSTSIQAEEVVATAGDLLERAVDVHFPRGADDGPDAEEKDWPEDFESEGLEVPATRTGYLNLINLEALLEIASRRDLRLEVTVRNGDFITPDSPVARVLPSGELDETAAEEIAEAFHLVRRRGAAEDVRLAVDRLTEVGVRALSPGINDPFTAIACIDRLGSGLALLAERLRPPRDACDDRGAVRVRLRALEVSELVDGPCQQLRIYGRDNPAVLARLLDAIALIASRARGRHLQQSLLRQARTIHGTIEELDLPEFEHDRAQRGFESLRRQLEEP